MGTKGSWQRKRNISQEEWEENDRRIFKRKKKERFECYTYSMEPISIRNHPAYKQSEREEE